METERKRFTPDKYTNHSLLLQEESMEKKRKKIIINLRNLSTGLLLEITQGSRVISRSRPGEGEINEKSE